MFTNLQKGFGGGEIAPELWGKTDHPKYPIALKQCENFKVTRAGNLTKCPGTEMVARTPNDDVVRLFKFVLDNESGFILEFSDGLMRVFSDGKPYNITSSAYSALVTYHPGDVVTYGMSLNYVAVYNPLTNQGITPGTDNTFWYQIGTVYSIPTVFSKGTMTSDEFSAFLKTIKFRQVNYVLYMVHPDYPPQELVFNKDNGGFYFNNVMQIPKIIASGFRFKGPEGRSGLQEYDYKITIENLATGEESFPIPINYTGGQNEVWECKPTPTWTVNPRYGTIRFTWNGMLTGYFTNDVTLNDMINGTNGFVAAWGEGVVTVTQQGNGGDQPVFINMVNNGSPLRIEFTGSGVNYRSQPINSEPGSDPWADDQGNPLTIPTVTEITRGWNGDIDIKSITFNTDQKYIEITTKVDHNLSDGNEVLVYGTGIPLMDNRVFNIITSGSDSNVYKIYTDPTGYGNAPSNAVGYSMPTELKMTSTSAPTNDNPIWLSWESLPEILPNYFPFQVEYNIYKGIGGVYGYIGSTQGHSFSDTGIPPDTTYCPPDYNPIFLVPNDYPSCVESYQQRLCLAATNNNLLEFNASRTGFLENFTTRANLQSDDAIIHQALEADAGAKIKHLVNFGFLIVFTDQGEIVLKGDSTGVLTPVNINTTPQTYNGASDLRPLKINKSVLYSQAQTSLVRDMQVQITPYGYTYIASSDEITLFSKHLVEGYSIVDWDFQKIYDGIVWCARNDGVALGLTYCPEQQIVAWWRRTTQGTFENFCSVTEGIEDAVYCVVKRGSKRFIERMSSDQWFDVKDSNFLDCAVSYDGRNTTSKMMTLTPGAGELWTLTCSENYFPGDTTDHLYNHLKWFIHGSDGSLVKCTPITFNSPTSLTVEVDRSVPDSINGVALTTWGTAFDIVQMDAVSGMAATIDGNVACNPLNDNISDTVSFITMDGETYAQLPDFGEVLRVGFPYMSSIETLDYDEPKDSYINKKTILKQCSLILKSSQNFWVGSEEPEDGVLGGLTEAKIRENAGYDETVDLVTGRVLVDFAGTFSYGAAGFLRSIDPIPLTISALGFTIDSKEMGK